jgi:hypothetical protein
MPYSKIAKHLLESNCELESFDVDFLDFNVTEEVVEELQKLGCEVERKPHRTKLHIICPQKKD